LCPTKKFIEREHCKTIIFSITLVLNNYYSKLFSNLCITQMEWKTIEKIEMMLCLGDIFKSEANPEICILSVFFSLFILKLNNKNLILKYGRQKEKLNCFLAFYYISPFFGTTLLKMYLCFCFSLINFLKGSLVKRQKNKI